MALEEDVRESAETAVAAYCENKVPREYRDELRVTYAVRGNAITIFEERPAWQSPGEWTRLSTAQLRYNAASGKWSLYWRDRNGRWHRYKERRPAVTVKPLLREVEQDPTGIFWG